MLNQQMDVKTVHQDLIIFVIMHKFYNYITIKFSKLLIISSIVFINEYNHQIIRLKAKILGIHLSKYNFFVF